MRMLQTILSKTAIDQSTKRLSWLACKSLQASIARLFFLNDDQILLISSTGAPEMDSSDGALVQHDSLSVHTLRFGTTLALDDVRLSAEFSQSPEISALNIVAYLSIPVCLHSGELIACLDVIDTRPRSWSEHDICLLQKLASGLVEELELRLKLEQLGSQSLSNAHTETLNPAYFRDVQELSPDGFMVFESVRNHAGQIVDFRWLYTNPAGERFSGRSHSDLLGKYLLEEMPGNRTEGLFDAYVQVVETGQAWQREFPYYHEQLAHWFRSKAVRTGDGFAVTFTDITKAKHDELRERLNEQRLRMALQTAQMDTWDWDIEANVFLLSTYAAQLFHLAVHRPYRLDDILACIYPKDRDHVAAAFASAPNSPYDLDLEFRVVSQVLPSWVALRGTRYQNEQGHTNIIGVVRDITERRQFEERQQFQIDAGNVFAASLDYQTTIEHILTLVVPRIADWCCIHTLDTNGVIELTGVLHANPNLTQKLASLRSIQPNTQGICDVSQVLQTERSLFYTNLSPEMAALIACDKTRYNDVQSVGCRSLICAPLISHGEVIGVLSLAMGHSGRRYIDQDWRMVDTLAHSMAVALENARLYSDTREAVRVREAFLSIAAHELRNPLTALFGQAQLMQRRLQRDPETSVQDQRTVGIIVDQANRLNKLIASLLDISRLERGEDPFDSYEIEMCSFTRRIIGEFQASLEKHVLIYTGEQGPLFIRGDTVRVEQVIQNLLTNAIKYSPKGGDIVISIQRNHDFLQLSVSDSGIGIPQSALPNLFRQFYRASNASSHANGLGIGLYIVREIVQRHGGRITVESVEKHGSTFRVFLPLMKPQPVLDDI